MPIDPTLPRGVALLTTAVTKAKTTLFKIRLCWNKDLLLDKTKQQNTDNLGNSTKMHKTIQQCTIWYAKEVVEVMQIQTKQHTSKVHHVNCMNLK